MVPDNEKDDASINRLQIAGVIVAALSLVPLAFDVPYLWVLTALLAAAGLALLIIGCVRALRFDPNAGDPEPRKALARGCTVWANQLEELLAAREAGTQASSPSIHEQQANSQDR